MYDFHLHSNLSFDSKEPPAEILKAAEDMGLKEICFTDHYDYNDEKDGHHDLFTIEEYIEKYGMLKSEKLKLRKGVEFGLTTWNQKELNDWIGKYSFDFVLGSVHYAGGFDPYYEQYWNGISFEDAVDKYMNQVLACVKSHDNYDVLGHLTYVCKSEHNPTHANIPYEEIKDITDEILRIVVSKGKGIEVNTSGVDRIGDFLPSLEYVKRFRELGGEIVTIGSDAHDRTRVGQYVNEALEMVSQVSPYVCTFENRKPVVHKL